MSLSFNLSFEGHDLIQFTGHLSFQDHDLIQFIGRQLSLGPLIIMSRYDVI